jgi:homoserine dehydrogenase
MKIAIIGAGAVGSSVAKRANAYGHTVTALADSKGAVVDADGVSVATALARKSTGEAVGTADPETVLNSTYDALVEATPTAVGNAAPAFSHIREALERDRHVVLANKGPVAERYADVRTLERESEGEVRFEATVGGAMPIIATIADLGPEHITAVRGVLNGTANFVLSRMAAEGLGYEHILTEVQKLGVAETDPSFAIDGTDAALKCAIIANVLAQDRRAYTLADVSVEGIKDVPGSALDLANEDGRTVRLIGEITDDAVSVGPRLVPENAPLAVSGMLNSVQMETEYTGSLNFSGRGTGGPEAATAVLMDICRLMSACS